MGQYILFSINHQLKVSKKDLENQKIDKDEMLEALSKEVSLSCYEMKEFETYYEFRAKESVFNSRLLADFLKEQFSFFECLEEDEILSHIKSTSSYEGIVNLARNKSSQWFQELKTCDKIRCGFWKSFYVSIEGIIFFMEGKAYLECYDSLFSYIEALIRKTSQYETAQLVKLFLD